MHRIPIDRIPEEIPFPFLPYLAGARLFDSSCSPDARVYYIDKEGGLYLKSAPAGTLQKEARMTGYFHEKGLSARVLGYEPRARDWLLTAAIPGEDCLHRQYQDDPARLSALLGQLLRMLHGTPAADCPVTLTPDYLTAAIQGCTAGRFDPALLSGLWRFSGPEEAHQVIREALPYFRADTLTHGDYCLPNVLLDNWHFSGFIDVGTGGLGDRHMDLFWGIWSIRFNLKNRRYCDRFLDAYGREAVEPELLRAAAAIECVI